MTSTEALAELATLTREGVIKGWGGEVSPITGSITAELITADGDKHAFKLATDGTLTIDGEPATSFTETLTPGTE